MKLSIIVPVYNVAKFLPRCLDSVLAAKKAATEVETEIICVNDGSTDNSAEVLSKYSSQVKIITQENRGLGPARNAGLEVMSGEYVMFVDSDDRIPEDAISKMMKVAKESKASLVVSMKMARNTLSPRKKNVPWKMLKNSRIIGNKIQYTACNKVYKAEIFKARRFAPIIFEDYPVTTGIMCEVEKFAAIAEPMYVYCDNGEESLVRSPYSLKKLKDKMFGVRSILGERDKAYAGNIPIRQASIGLSTVIGKVYHNCNDSRYIKALFVEMLKLGEDLPLVSKHLTIKAKFRLWSLRRKFKGQVKNGK